MLDLPNNEEMMKKGILAAERELRAQQVDEATLWVFTASRLLRAAVAREEAWAVRFVEEIRQELSGCAVDPDRMITFIQDESEKLASLMEEESHHEVD